ncbi:acyl-CoA desaturase [Legionella bononiensis]|uniref:Acyl-CoA desaturase n=1 Tax=Legionella bononiensis TaxID=2793102 RepID=A0ABS1W7N3_9GAMM|nr:acyl-CoA desaturase [Legionella bononiensis]MBL7480119.1 acyl-CoA desaturase [Legionella bononiensis]MBL7525366.1 acyl-CoA desaturase [Legionella bononiensis]MBL7561550.1 acyl-CoA desaturase [Legionella bononiensis]
MMKNTIAFYLRKAFFHWREPGDQPLQGLANINWRFVIEQIIYHAGALCVVYVGVSKTAFFSFLFFDIFRAFCVTILLHRYFTHRCFETSRGIQFIFALLALTPLQRGPLWWVSHHRRHHQFTDKPGDPHTPKQGFFYSHLGWYFTINDSATDKSYLKDWLRYPELIWIDRLEWLAPIVMMVLAYSYGALINHFYPDLGTNGWQMLVWLFFIPTVCVLHGSCIVNSVLHHVGYRRFNTNDNSRNMWLLALFTLGEGFHNNHHRYQASCKQGIYWWEIDLSYYVIKLLEKLKLISNLRYFPQSILDEGQHIIPYKEE